MKIFVISKDTTPMNSPFERTMFTSKSNTDFSMQKSFKERNTQPDTARCQFIEHFNLKVQYTAKLTHAFEANQQNLKQPSNLLKRSVQRKLRPMLLFIIQKLFTRRWTAEHINFQFTIYIKPLQRSCPSQITFAGKYNSTP